MYPHVGLCSNHTGIVPLPGYGIGLLAERPQQLQVREVDDGQARVQDHRLHVVLVDDCFGARNLRPSNLEGKLASDNPDAKKKKKIEH